MPQRRQFVTKYLDRLGLADAVNASVPWQGDVPLGTLVEVMVCNRLLNPKALFRVDTWAQTAAVTDYFELEAGQLNDDRLGRTDADGPGFGPPLFVSVQPKPRKRKARRCRSKIRRFVVFQSFILS